MNERITSSYSQSPVDCGFDISAGDGGSVGRRSGCNQTGLTQHHQWLRLELFLNFAVEAMIDVVKGGGVSVSVSSGFTSNHTDIQGRLALLKSLLSSKINNGGLKRGVHGPKLPSILAQCLE